MVERSDQWVLAARPNSDDASGGISAAIEPVASALEEGRGDCEGVAVAGGGGDLAFSAGLEADGVHGWAFALPVVTT
jgi:hypothetical protein